MRPRLFAARASHTSRRGALALLAVIAAACGTPGGDAQSGRWRDGPALPGPRFEAAAVAVGGRVYYLGGIVGIEGRMETAQPVARVDVLDPASGQWTPGPELPVEAPKHHLAVAVVGARIYVLGGFDGIIGRGIPTDAFRPIATTWVLDTSVAGGGAWQRRADQPIARGGATAQAIAGIVYVAGGTTDEGQPSFADVYAYDPARDQWTARAPLPTPREHLASCALDGAMIVVGGWTGAARTAQHAAERYDPARDQWTALPPLPTARGGLGAIALEGRCYAVGGEDWALAPPGTFASVEVFDPARGAWSSAAPMQLARHGIGLALLGGELWVVGGGPSQGNSYTARVEVFAPR